MQLLLYPVILDLFCARQVLPAFGYRKDVEVVKSRLVVYETGDAGIFCSLSAREDIALRWVRDIIIKWLC